MSTSSRASWEVRVVRDPFSQEEEDADAKFWDRIPVADRAQATWELSKELRLLVERNAGHNVTEAELERRLPRAAFRVERR
jgi:hypothetical protein